MLVRAPGSLGIRMIRKNNEFLRGTDVATKKRHHLFTVVAKLTLSGLAMTFVTRLRSRNCFKIMVAILLDFLKKTKWQNPFFFRGKFSLSVQLVIRLSTVLIKRANWRNHVFCVCV